MEPPKGITNLGNTCFLNSCMQILFQIHELDNIDCAVKHVPETRVFQEWVNWKKSLFNPNIQTISPVSFIQTIHQIAQQKNRILFTGYAQNDLPEFLLFFIDSLHIYLQRPMHVQIEGHIGSSMDQLALQSYSMLKETYEKEYSEIMDVFYGVMVSSLLSTHPPSTQLESKSESFFILDLPIVGNNIYECLDKYVQPELLENENAWYNEKTQQKEPVFKKISFWNFPKILVISFKRFSQNENTISKKMDPIQFPLENLDISKYVCGYNAQSYKYDLFGVCNHIGGVMGGHYTAFVKTRECNWYHCNDQSVEKITDPQQMITPMAYTLFYRKK